MFAYETGKFSQLLVQLRDRLQGCILVIGRRNVVLVWTLVAIWAVALKICFACRAIWVEAKSVFTSKEFAEFKVILWRPRLCGFLFARWRY
jgi:hypothetical protein